MRDQELVNKLRTHLEVTRKIGLYPGKSGIWAVIEQAADRIANQSTHIAALQQEIEKLRGLLPRWIPMAERLPELDELVLVIASGKPKENITLDGAIELATLYSDGWCLETWPEWTGANVTYWMPLPEPPEEER